MHTHDLKLPLLYLRHIGEQLRSMDVETSEWLELSGLSEARLDDRSLTIPRPAFRRLVLNALTIAREPALGLFIGERLVASTHGFVGYAALNSATIGEAFDVLEQFISIRTSLVAMSLERLQGEVHVCFSALEPLEDIARPVFEAVLLSIKNVLDAASMGAYEVRYVAFPFDAPEYAELTGEFFGCEVRYGQGWAGYALSPESLRIIPESSSSSKSLAVPLRLADPKAFEEAARICQRELDKLAANESLAARVRRLLLEKQNGFPSLQVTARSLHMTPRTLHRRLVREGSSYRLILEHVRRTLAVDHLRSGRFSVEEVAYILGYSDSANFRRAFKRWESVPPSAFCAKILEDQEAPQKRPRGRG